MKSLLKPIRKIEGFRIEENIDEWHDLTGTLISPT
jgi:hypothetical protein